MAKISPVSIKYMIHANFVAEGALEKPDVIGAVFGQTEGLLGADLEMRELQKEGKIGRIEVELERRGKQTAGKIKIPTALDQSETTLIAAAIETIERIGPSDAQIEVDRIEDVRGSKREYILERAKKLMKSIQGSADSREISKEIKESARMEGVSLYGAGKLPSGDISGRELIVVEGRADVLNLLKSGVKNVISMNGTRLPPEIKDLSHEKEVTLFVDGDRGGKLIIQNVTDNTKVVFVAIAPDGKEVEELTNKEVFQSLRKKMKVDEYFSKLSFRRDRYPRREIEETKPEAPRKVDINADAKKKLKELSDKNKDSKKAILLDDSLEIMKNIPVKTLGGTLRRMRNNPSVIIIDGIVTSSTIRAAEEANIQAIVAKNFATTDTRIQLLSL